ncbi:glycosyltransferase family 39 protein [Candidatus Microgenomates bacterium]|nr:glycosyltransferase family 39 protein [Candidatus Microgenomates bacterium]
MIYLILFLSLLLRVIFLNQSFWLDEATSANLAKNFSFVDIIVKFSPGDFHPPFYYLLLKLWSIPFGVSEVSARSLSVLVAVITVYVTYLIAKKLFSKSVGIMASLLLATAPLHIYYSQEARMYVLQTLFVSLSVLFFVNIIKENKLKDWLVFAITLPFIGATDYLPLLVLPVFWLVGLGTKKPLSWWGKLIAAHIPLAILFSLWSPIFINQLKAGLSVQSNSPNWWKLLGGSNLKELILLPTKFLMGRISFDNKYLYGFLVVLVLAMFVAVTIKGLKLYKKALVIWLWLIVPVVLAFMIGLKISVFSYFRLLFVLPAMYLLIAIGLSKIKENIFPFAFMALVAINIVFSWQYLSNEKFHREDWRTMSQTIKEDCKQKKCAVVFPSTSQQEAYRYYTNGELIVKSEDLNQNYDQIYLVRYVWEISDPQDKTRQQIEKLDYKKHKEDNFGGVLIWEYKK